MKIWHSGAHWSPLLVNGVNALIYSVAREQASRGHDVTLLLCGPPDQAATEYAASTGVRLLQLPPGIWSHARAAQDLLDAESPEVVHMHSVFIPQQAALTRALRRKRTPYIITPNGGVSPFILGRNRLKKSVYSLLVEKRRFRRAAGISVVADGEEAEVRSFVPDFQGPIACIPNTVDPAPLDDHSWRPPVGRPKLVYLGRFDVVHKGIDILFALAERLPEADFHLYGSEDPRTRSDMAHLCSRGLRNLYIHPPVFGREKADVLSAATMYVQTSRWEAFGISIAEALYLGVPCAIASTLHLAAPLRANDLGLVFPPDPSHAAAMIAEALHDPARLADWSERGKSFARAHYHPGAVASSFVEMYRGCAAA